MDKYEYFARNNSYYHIPKDYYETIQKSLKGESVEGLADSTLQKIQQKVREIEQVSGKSFDEVIKPGVSKYSEVQQGKIHHSLDRHEQELGDENKRIKESIQTEAQSNLGDLAQVASTLR